MENKPKPLLNSVIHGSFVSRKRKQALSLNKVCLARLNSYIKLWVNKVSFEVSHCWLAIRKSHGAVGWENVYYTSQKSTNAGYFKTCIKKMKENPCFLRTPPLQVCIEWSNRHWDLMSNHKDITCYVICYHLLSISHAAGFVLGILPLSL